jgi:hypothetical protein
MVGGESGAGQVGLDAAGAAAVARGQGQVLGPGAGSGLCPHSPAIAFGPVNSLPCAHDAAADAGAQDHAEHDFGAGPRAVDRFR